MTSPDSDRARAVNLLAVAALGLTDALTDGLDLDPTDANALVALLDFTPHGTIGALAGVLGLTHSGAVRLVNRLARDDLVVRRRGDDGRTAVVELTRRGRRIAHRLRTRRAEVTEQAMTGLDADQRARLAEACAVVIGNLARDRMTRRTAGAPPASGALCRWCDFTACGRPVGQCPAAGAHP